ncbi:MAG TPA: tetratricopeptide repeat protein, partial [Chthoniobacterales bacterium]|nr:tetratricopeptide repeat protein [Chthoniobacterales bacterium]
MSETEHSSGGQSAMSRWLDHAEQPWIRCLLLFVSGIAARFPALQGQLVWDDTWLVRDNPFIKSALLIPESFRHFLSLDTSSSHYRPVQNISYFFDYLIWNADPYGYHLSNLFWHVGSGILLYFLLQRLFEPFRERFEEGGRRLLSAAAFFVALLWIVHPVHSAAVDYISGRADSLAFFFACGAWLLYLRARRVQSSSWRFALHTVAAISALLALCSRETACIWMLLFLVHLFALDRRATRRDKCIVLAVCLFLVGLYAGLRQLPPAPETVASSASSIQTRGTLMLRALGDYSRLMLFPSNLHMERTVATSGALLSIIGALAAAALLYGAFRKGKAQPIRAFGAAWFILAFLPISNLFELNATVAEHWLYLPSVGFLLFVVGCCLELPARYRGVLAAAACAALLALSARSFVRSGDWLNPETFYRHALRSGATKTRMALNLAQIYAERGDYAKAEPLLRKVVAMNPDYPMAQNALGHLLLSQGKREEAEKVFAVATELASKAGPDQQRTWIAALNTAFMHHTDRNFAAALIVLQKARADFPGTWPLIKLESEVLQAVQRNDEALALVKEFSRANWWHAPAAITLGRIHLEADRFVEAAAALRHASRLDIHDAESLNLLALVDVRQDRLQDACATQRRAVSRQPDQPRQYLLLADILGKMGRADEAQAALA